MLKKICFILSFMLAVPAFAGWEVEDTISASVTSASSKLLGAGQKMLICSTAAYIKFGPTAPTATTGDIPVQANERYRFSRGPLLRYVAVILSASTATCKIYASDSPSEPIASGGSGVAPTYPVVSAGFIDNAGFSGSAPIAATATACHCTARDAAATSCSLSAGTLTESSSAFNDRVFFTCYSGVS